MVDYKVKRIKDNLESFPDGMMKLEYIVDLGKKSQKDFPEQYRTKKNFIHGCTAHAWLKLENSDPIQLQTVSDSVIISGILYLLELVFNGESKSSITEYDGPRLIEDLGLRGSITSMRLRGFAEAIKMMKNE